MPDTFPDEITLTTTFMLPERLSDASIDEMVDYLALLVAADNGNTFVNVPGHVKERLVNYLAEASKEEIQGLLAHFFTDLILDVVEGGLLKEGFQLTMQRVLDWLDEHGIYTKQA